MNRRKFIANTTKQLALLNVVGLAATQSSIGNELSYAPENSLEEGEIIYRTLGRTGIQVPVVSMGVMNATIPGLITRSHEKGVRLFDTAWYYQNGMNEKMLGDAMEAGGLRDDSIIVTKVYLKEAPRDLYQPETKKLFLARFEESLQRLKMDYVDILFYHASSESKEHNNPYIIEAFHELKAAGKVKHFGVSLHGDDATMLDEISETKFYDVAMVMFNIAFADNEKLIKSIENAANSGVGIIGMKTQCGGGGGYMWWEKHGDSRETLGSLNHTAMLKWVLQHKFIATTIPGYTGYDQLDENFSVAYDLNYSDEEREFMDKAQLKIAQSFCVKCQGCHGTCPKGVEIPTLMRTYMYAYHYNNMEHAMATAKAIPPSIGLNQCFGCDKCQVNCQRDLNVAQRIDALKELNFNLA